MTKHATKMDPTTKRILRLARKDSGFRSALATQLRSIAPRDFTVDPGSQQAMLRGLVEGDVARVTYLPKLEQTPEEDVELLVLSGFDPTIPGVRVSLPTGGDGLLVDGGPIEGVLYQGSRKGPAHPVRRLSLVRSRLAADESKPTAAQVQFALDLAKDKGKDYTKAQLEKKTKAEVSKLIDDMQKEPNAASSKQVSYALDLLKAQGKKTPSKGELEKMPEVEVSKLIDKLKKENGSS